MAHTLSNNFLVSKLFIVLGITVLNTFFFLFLNASLSIGYAEEPSKQEAWQSATAIKEAAHNAGSVFPGTFITQDFVIENTNNADCQIIDYKTSCSCLVTSEIPDLIKAKNQAVISLAVNAGDTYRNEQVRGSLLGRIGDAYYKWTFTITYQVANYLEIPNQIVQVQPQRMRTVILKRGLHPDKWSRFTITTSQSSKLINFDLKNSDADSWELVLSTAENSHRGLFNDHLTFTFFDQEQQLTHQQNLRVRAYVPGSLIPSNTIVIFGNVQTNDSLEKNIVLRPKSGIAVINVSSIQCADPERMAATIEKEKEELRLNLRLNAIGPVGKASSEIVLHLENGELLHIPYLAVITNNNN